MERPAALNGMGTWRRYKLGQAQFTNWLKQTAEKLVPRTSEPEPAPNRDGDAAPQQSRSQRKKAAKAAAAGLAFEANSANANPEADKSVHWSELEVLARRVADNADPDDIPDAPLNILRDVVGLRKKSFRFFSSATKDSTDEKVKQSNANHAHIIGVLERVLAKLDGLIKSGRGRERKSQSRDHARVSTADLTNMFSYLELQPAPDAADDVADGAEEGGPSANTKQQHQKATKKKGAKKTRKPREPERRAGHTSGSTSGRASWVDNFDFGLPHESEGEEDEFDLYMRLYCFFEDFNAIRNYVAERWCDYWYDGAVPLDTLAVITNAASELFHQLEYELVNDLRPLHPRLAEYDFMMNMLFLQYGLDHVDYDSYEDLAQDEMDDRIWRDEADWLALTSYFTLQQTLKMIPPGKVPMLPPSNRRPTPYGATNCRAWRDFESNISTQITMECAHLKALKTNEQQPPALPAEPLFLQDFQAYLRRKRYGAALIFSHHVWVDIRHIMEREHARPFEQLQRTATQLQRALESHNPIQYCKDHDFKRGWLGRMWETKHYMLEDFMFDDKKTRFRKIGVEEDPEPFFLLKHEPVWAGLLGFRARLAYSQQGHDFVRLSSVVDAAACLYHAALAVDPSLPPWADMSKYVDTYADDSQFKLGLQERQDPAAIVRKFAALIGQYPQGDKAESRIGDGKEFIPTIAVRQRLYDRYAAERELVAFVEYIDKLATPWLQAQSSAQEQSQNGTAATNPSYGSTLNGDVHTVANGNENAASTNDAGSATEAAGETEEAARRKAMASRLSPVEMLQLLDDIVTSQLEGLLTLDYFKLFDDSVALLEAVSAALGPEVQAGLGPKDGDSHAYLGSLPVVLSQHLDRVSGVEQETEVLAVVAKACRHFVEGKLLQA